MNVVLKSSLRHLSDDQLEAIRAANAKQVARYFEGDNASLAGSNIRILNRVERETARRKSTKGLIVIPVGKLLVIGGTSLLGLMSLTGWVTAMLVGG